MNISRSLLAAALCVGLAVPVAAFAQQANQIDPTSGTVTGAPAGGAGRHHQRGLMRRAMNGITLTDAQKQQLQTLQQQYAQGHPAGSTPDPAAAKTFRASLLNVLTPDQQTQYLKNLDTLRKQHRDHRGSSVDPNPEPSGGPFAPDPSPTPSAT
jgi:Spy/CpxP family protein refolding chaperone